MKGRPKVKKDEDFSSEEVRDIKRIKWYEAGKYTKNVHKKPTRGERVFVDVYCSNGFKQVEAVKIAFPNVKPSAQYAYHLLHRPKVKYLIDKKIEEDIMSKVDKTTEEILTELDLLLQDSKKSGEKGYSARVKCVELYMKHKAMLVDKQIRTDETFAEWMEKQEKKKASGSELNLVEMPKKNEDKGY